jgi:hypothetical protein
MIIRSSPASAQRDLVSSGRGEDRDFVRQSARRRQRGNVRVRRLAPGGASCVPVGRGQRRGLRGLGGERGAGDS